MKIRNTSMKKNIIKGKTISAAIKKFGFLFPTTIKDVKDFESTFGTTDMILPPDVQEFRPVTKEETTNRGRIYHMKTNDYLEYALAAREQESLNIPEDIRNKMISDRKNAQKAQKKRKKR